MRKRVVVLGAGFAGLTTALEIKRQLHGDVDVTVVAPDDRFVFTPSLIWMPFGIRHRDDITFSVRPTLHEHDISFVRSATRSLDPVLRSVSFTDGRRIYYDYLVVATGSRSDNDALPGFSEHATTITTLADAERATRAWRRLPREPGDVVVAAAQGASCFGAAYEFLFNAAHQLRREGLHRQVRLTYVTSEPYLGHFGVGGLQNGEQLLASMLQTLGIEHRIGRAIDRVDDGALVLADGETLPFRFGMVIPPFRGQPFLAGHEDLVDDNGFVDVRPTYQSDKYDDLYAVGAAVAVEAPWHSAVAVGVPKTGFAAQQMAGVAAHNIAAQVRGGPVSSELRFADIKAVSVVDAGRGGLAMLADRTLPPRQHGLLLPGPHAHLMKLAFEKYYLWKMRHGRVQLP